MILIPPSSNQRVRYENECRNIFRYISVPNNKTMTIKVNEKSLECVVLSISIQIDS